MNNYLHGVATTGDLRAAGLGTKAIASRVRDDELIRTQRELYRHPAAEQTPRQLAAMGILANRQHALVTGAWAVRWHGCEVPTALPIDLVIEEGRAATQVKDVRIRRSSHLDLLTAELYFGLPTVPLWWALGDLARDVDDRAMARTIASGIGRRLITLDHLEDSLTRRVKFPGSARLRRVAEQLRSDLPFSGLERRAAQFLRREGFPVQLNYEVRDSGVLVRKADLALVPERLDLEIDGPHHWLPEQAEHDRRIDRRMRSIDWLVDRVACYELDKDPTMILGVIKALLKRRSER